MPEQEKNSSFVDSVRKRLQKFLQTEPEKSTEYKKADGLSGFAGMMRTWRAIYDDMLSGSGTRAEKYRQREFLDKNLAEASATLNVYADNVVSGTVGGDENYYVAIDEDSADVERMEEIIQEVEDRTRIKDQVWDITRKLNRDGDVFAEQVLAGVEGDLEQLKLKILPVNEIYANVDEYGNMVDPTKPYYQQAQGTTERIPLDWWRIIHFKVGSDIYGVDNSVFSPAALRIGRQLIWCDDALVIARISRAWQRWAFMVDTPNMSPDDAFAYVQKFMDRVKSRRIGNDSASSQMQSSLLDIPLMPDEDVGIPVMGNSKADVKTLSGDPNVGRIEDILYLQRKFLVACTMPKAYVSLEEGVNARATMGFIDVQFARQVRRRQQNLMPGLKKFYEMAFILKGVDPGSFEWTIEFPELATSDEMLKWEMLSVKAGIARVLAVDVGVVNTEYVLRELLDFDDDEVKKYAAAMPSDGTGGPAPTPKGAAAGAAGDAAAAAGMAPDNQMALPPSTAEIIRRDPVIRTMLNDLKDIVSWRLRKEDADQKYIKVGREREVSLRDKR